MRISSFTEYELEHLRQNCNFVGNEKDVFRLRSEGVSLELIAEMLGYTNDGIKKVSRRINNKIIKVLDHEI